MDAAKREIVSYFNYPPSSFLMRYIPPLDIAAGDIQNIVQRLNGSPFITQEVS